MPPPPAGRVILSLFDRLTADQPNLREAASPEGDLRTHVQSVARDLTNLLNVRRSDEDIPDEFVQTRESVAAYGIEDFTTAPMDRESIRRAILRTVRLFEPRLSRVEVILTEGSDLKFSFRISALLRVDAGMEPVVYDADLPKVSRRIRVTPGR